MTREDPQNVSLRILVTDAHEWSGLGAIRSLGRAGHDVVGGFPAGQARPPATFSRYCSRHICYPDPWTQQFHFREWLINEARQGNFDALMATTEAVVLAAAACRKDLEPHWHLLLPGDQHLRYTLSKYHATEKALQVGLEVPKTVFVHDTASPESWVDDLSPLTFPIFVKTDNYLADDGRYVKGKARHASSPAEAEQILNDCRATPTNVIAQEHIPGRGVGAFLLRHNGQIRLRYTHRRLHELPYTGGYSCLRVSTREPEILAAAENLLHAIDYEGAAMVEFRQRDLDGRPCFLEINGRLWGSIALALHLGLDFPLTMLDCHRRQSPNSAPPPYREGVRCRNTFPGEIRYLTSIFDSQESANAPSKGRSVLEFFLLSLNPFIRHDHFWWSDLRPWFATFRRTINKDLPRLLKRRP